MVESQIGRVFDRLHHLEVIIRLRGFFVPDVFLPYLIGHIPARHYPLAPCPEVPPPLTFANTLVPRQQLVRTFAILVLDCPGDREIRQDPY